MGSCHTKCAYSTDSGVTHEPYQKDMELGLDYLALFVRKQIDLPVVQPGLGLFSLTDYDFIKKL